jgi:hypothetical protein
MEEYTAAEYLFLVRLDGHNTVSRVTVADCVVSAPVAVRLRDVRDRLCREPSTAGTVV